MAANLQIKKKLSKSANFRRIGFEKTMQLNERQRQARKRSLARSQRNIRWGAKCTEERTYMQAIASG